MKTQCAVLVVLFLFLISACRKEPETVVPTDTSFKAQKNSSNWVSTNSWGSYSPGEKKFSISAVKQNPKFNQDEELSISFVMTDLTKPFVTNKFNSEWTQIVGGDAVSDRYYLDESENNQVEILSVDTEKKIISGKFTVRLIRDSKYSTKGETFVFHSSYFSVSYAVLNNKKGPAVEF